MFELYRIVNHVIQKKYEYYGYSELYGWISIDKEMVDDIHPKNIEYVELRHHMEKDKFGRYGHHIIG